MLFRSSFGVQYNGVTVWVPDEVWYKAWVSGTVVPGTIVLQESQRKTYKLDANKERMVDAMGRPILEDVPGEKRVDMVQLHTKEMLENEDDLKAWNQTRNLTVKRKQLDAIHQYNEIAKRAAAVSPLSADETAMIDAYLAGVEA